MVRILLVLILSVQFSLPIDAGGRGDVVRILVRHGADAHLVDGEGKAAADYASEENHRRLAEELGRVSE